MWLKDLFSEPEGKISWGRVGSGITLGFVLWWVTSLVGKNHVLPDLLGPSAFIGTLYGLSAAKSTAKSFSNGNGGVPKP